MEFVLGTWESLGSLEYLGEHIFSVDSPYSWCCIYIEERLRLGLLNRNHSFHFIF